MTAVRDDSAQGVSAKLVVDPPTIVRAVESTSYEQFSVIIPTLNEAGNIRALIDTVFLLYPGICVIVADDGSTDGTRAIVTALQPLYSRLILADRGEFPIRGLSASVVDGVLRCRTKYFAVIDGDFQHPPETLRELFLLLESGVEIVLGCRAGIEPHTKLRKFYTGLGTQIARTVLLRKGLTISDPLTGLFGGRTDIFVTLSRIDIAHWDLSGYKIVFDLLSAIARWNAVAGRRGVGRSRCSRRAVRRKRLRPAPDTRSPHVAATEACALRECSESHPLSMEEDRSAMNKTGADRVTVGQKARPASSEEHRLDEPALDAERVGGGGGERREEVLGARRRALLHAELASSIAPEIDASWMPTVQLQPKLMYFGRSQRVLYCSAAHPGAFQRVSSAGSPAAEWPLGRAAHASIAVGEICFPFMPRNAGSSKLSLIHCLGFFFAAIRAELRR